MINRIIKILSRLTNRNLIPIIKIPFAQYSVIVPTESWESCPNERLIEISLAAIQHARTIDHTEIASKMIERPLWPIIWPGEHYRLLSGLIKELKPKIVVEIGTATGYSALAIKKFLPPESKLFSFDIVPWTKFPNCILNESDFEDGRLEQVIADLSNPIVFETYKEFLSHVDFIFVDAAKDGVQEKVFLDHFEKIDFKSSPIFMFDDIRVMNMINIWNSIKKPKIDLTSFGHWAGTGLVDWKG